jgi:CDP-diacylglycerol--glycerol-3-phosphate 3-phosphatidyltransferase
MISVYQLKPKFQQALQPILKMLYRAGITPNQLTLSAVLLSIGLGYLLWYQNQYDWFLVLVPIGLLLRMMLNALDGMMARQFKLQSKKGEVLNELGDVISDVVIVFPLIFVPGINPYLVLLFAFLAVLNEFSGLLGKAIGKERRYDGPMGKSDRALFLGLFCFIYYFWRGLNEYADYIFGTAICLVLFSTFIRLKKAIN